MTPQPFLARKTALYIALPLASVFLTTTILLLTGMTHGMDFTILDHVRATRTESGTLFIGAITAFGDKYLLLVLVLLSAGLCWMRNLRREAMLLGMAVMGGAAINYGLKIVIDRPRPVEYYAAGIDSTSGAFPSGHAMMSALVYGLLAAIICHWHPRRSVRRAAVATAIVLPLLIAASRVYLGAHHPADVIAGWSLGLALAIHAAWVYHGLEAAPQPTDQAPPSENK